MKPIRPAVYLFRIPVIPPKPFGFAPVNGHGWKKYERVEYDVVAYPTARRAGEPLRRWTWWAHGCPTRRTRSVTTAGVVCAVVWMEEQNAALAS